VDIVLNAVGLLPMPLGMGRRAMARDDEQFLLAFTGAPAHDSSPSVRRRACPLTCHGQ
jgi:hypothetical protein